MLEQLTSDLGNNAQVEIGESRWSHVEMPGPRVIILPEPREFRSVVAASRIGKALAMRIPEP